MFCGGGGGDAGGKKQDGKVGMKAAVEALGELWEEGQYEEQFDVEQFTKRLKR